MKLIYQLICVITIAVTLGTVIALVMLAVWLATGDETDFFEECDG